MKTTFTIILFIIFLNVSAQSDYSEYTKYVIADSIGKIFEKETKNGIEKIKYLGVISKEDGSIGYHVLTISHRIQKAERYIGYAIILFLNTDKIRKKHYELNMQEELPYKLKNNTLYFHYIETKSNKRKVFKNKINMNLPKYLSVNPSSSYYTSY